MPNDHTVLTYEWHLTFDTHEETSKGNHGMNFRNKGDF